MKSLTLRFSLLLLVAIPAQAWAQTPSERIAELRRTARTQLGPFLVWPTLVIGNVGTDTNVRLDADSGEPVSDFTATVTPGLRVRLPVARRALLTLDTTTSLVWYQDFKDERSANPAVSGGGELFLGKITLSAGAGFSRSSDRPSLEIDQRSVHRSRSFSGGIAYQIRPLLSVSVDGRRNTVRFADDEIFLGTVLQLTLNRETDDVTFTVRQTLTPKTRIHLRSALERTEFEFISSRNADGFRIMPGVTFAPSALISGTAEVGYGRLNPRNPVIPNFSGVVAAVDLGYRMLESTQVTAGWGRDIEYSFFASRPYYVINSLRASVRRQIAGRFDTILGVARYEHSYPDGIETTEIDPFDEITHVYTADIGFRLTKNSRMGIAAVSSNRTSTTNPDRIYERLRVGLTLTYGM